MATAEQRQSRSSLGGLIPMTLISLRRLRLEGGASLVLAGVVLLTAFAVAALPRFLNDVSDDALRTAVRAAAPINRNISIDRGGRIAASSAADPFQGVIDEGLNLRQEFSEPVDDLIGDQRFVADTTNYEVSAMPGDPVVPFPRFLRIRYQQAADQHVTLVEGRMPEPTGRIDVQLEQSERPLSLPVHEVAISPETAEEMRIGVGDSILITPVREDSLNVGLALSEINYTLVARIAGIIEIDNPDDEYWYGDTRLERPVIVENPDFVLIYGMGLMAPANYDQLLQDTAPGRWNYSWRYFVNSEQLDGGRLDQVTKDLQALEVQFGNSGRATIEENRLRTGLVRIADLYRSQRQLTISMLSLVIAGTAIVAIAVVALLGALIAARRREATMLVRSRGGTARQIGWSEAIESFVIYLPAALLGLLLALVFISGRGSSVVVMLVLGVTIVTTAIVLLLALPDLRGDLGSLLQATRGAPGRSRYRLVVEALLVLAAVGGLVLFRRRGLEAGSLSDPTQGFDPFLTMVPVLLTLAVGVLLLRLYPLPIRMLAWFGSLRRGTVMFVGFRRIAQQPLAARLPLVVMLVATGLAVFSAVVLYSITEGQQNSTWQEVGADYRLQSVRENAPVSSFIDISGVEAIDATAEGAVLEARDVTSSIRGGSFTLLAIDPEAYQNVTSGTRADPMFPEAMLIDQNIQGIGTAANPIPALVSSNWTGGQAVSVGDTIELEVRRSTLTIVVRGVRDRFASLQPGEQFVVLPRGSLDIVDPTLDLRATFVYIKAPDSANDELRAAVRGQSFATDFISRPDLLEDIADAPLVDGVEGGFRATVILATLYAVLAALAGIALTARDRARDLGYLRTLGLTSAQASVLTAIEQLPPAIIAAFAGAGLGYLMVWLVEPGLDLSTFAGTNLPTEVIFNGRTVWLVAGIELVTVLIAIVVYSFLTRRMQLGNVLRLGDRT